MEEGGRVMEAREAAGPITAAWIVDKVLTAYPEALEVFVSFGFEQLANPILRKSLAKVATLDRACMIKGVDVAELVKALNERITASGQADVQT